MVFCYEKDSSDRVMPIQRYLSDSLVPSRILIPLSRPLFARSSIPTISCYFGSAISITMPPAELQKLEFSNPTASPPPLVLSPLTSWSSSNEWKSLPEQSANETTEIGTGKKNAVERSIPTAPSTKVCICSPTSHTGSFRCHLHRTAAAAAAKRDRSPTPWPLHVVYHDRRPSVGLACLKADSCCNFPASKPPHPQLSRFGRAALVDSNNASGKSH